MGTHKYINSFFEYCQGFETVLIYKLLLVPDEFNHGTNILIQFQNRLRVIPGYV